MFEDHAFEQGLDYLLLFGREFGDAFKLKLKITIRPAFIRAKDQHICTHLQSDREPSNHVKCWLRGTALVASYLNHVQVNLAARIRQMFRAVAAQHLRMWFGRVQLTSL